MDNYFLISATGWALFGVLFFWVGWFIRGYFGKNKMRDKNEHDKNN